MKLMDRKTLSSAKEIEKLLGGRIRELRKEQGLTQEKLAEISDLHVTYLGLIEIGKKLPSLHTIVKIAKALKSPLHALFMFEPEIPPKERNLRELIDLLKSGNTGEIKFLLTMAKEHRKTRS